ncbi:MAG: Ig-like domain-containing protein [Kiritimatiellae bacterium]|nr:Ig-like domain-containing protein [Kiritimatiellia bacterium]
MKKTLMFQCAGVMCLLAGLAVGGTVAVTPASKTYLQTELTIGTPVSLPITLSGWGDTNLTVSATGGGTIFEDVLVLPVGEAPQTTDRRLFLTPTGEAGDGTVTVTVEGTGLSPTNITVSLTVTPVPVLGNLPTSVSFSEDTTCTTNFTVTYWGKVNNLVWEANIATGSNVLQSAAIIGAGLSRNLVLVPRNNKVGEASVRVIMSDATHSTTQTVAVTVDPVPDFPVVTGLSSPLSVNEDTTTNHVFSVTDLDDGASGAITNVASVVGDPSSLLSSVTVSGTTNNVTLQLTPTQDAYGWVTVRVVTAHSTLATTNSIVVKVQPVADAPTFADWPTAPVRLSVGGLPTNQFLSAVTVADADHRAFKNGTSNEYLKASADLNNVSIHFSSGDGSWTTNLVTGLIPSNLTTWARSLSLYPPESSYAPVGQVSTNVLTLRVYGFGSNDTLSVTSTVPVLLLNPNHLPDYIPSVSPSVLQEGQTITPFGLSQLFDQDASHTFFSLRLFIKPEEAALATLGSTATLYGNESELNLQLTTIGFTAVSGGISTLTTNVTVYYVLSDSIDYVTNSVTLAINAISTAPVINGIDEMSAYYSISDAETVFPFPAVIPYDTDQGGKQWLSASFSVSEPALGGFTYQEDPVLNFSLRSQADLQAALRQLKFVPVVGALTIGTSAEVTLTLTLTDSTGLSTVNSSTRILITAVNQPPVIKVPREQPVLLPPGGDLRPFAGTAVSNDDTNSVTLTVTLDDNDKGTLGNLGGFTYASGTYTMSGAIDAINASLTNLTYAVNPQHLFPPDDPGGTVFTLEAEDYLIKLGSAQVWVQIQTAPRNHLVTKTANDGTPGSLLFALAHAGNNDVITFALPAYPAVIRVPEAFAPLVLSTSLTLKGPGADLLTISGDSNGDGTADGQLFAVQSRVTIEGVTLSHGHATLGGAVSVAENGTLTLRACAVTDCEAEEYGGAIDVEGALRLENCYLARNRVSETGGGGGAVSFYTALDSAIVNTTFASNRIDNASGAGGGALNVERADGIIALVDVALTHCTFAGNSDASDRASAVYVVGGNASATLKNNIFSDYSELEGARNIDVYGDGNIASEGGNVCDDSTRTMFQQGGGTSVFLLTHTGDRTEVTPGLGGLTQAKGDTTPSFPLQAGSPALCLAQSSAVTTDQRGRIRRSQPGDSGAIQQDADERVTITEIQLSAEADDKDPFIEVFVPRDGQDVDLDGFKLFINGVAVHEFGQGVLALTNSVHTTFAPATGISASYLLAPGRGVVVAFPKGEIADFTGFASLNPTPVVRASIATNAAEFAPLISSHGRGSVAIAKSETAEPIVLQTFLTVFNDPDSASGTNRLDTAHNSIVSAPQSRGYAFIPHSSVSSLIYGGWQGLPSVTPAGVLLQSPGATVDGTPFGLDNAFPQAASDVVNMSEDDVGAFDVLVNDLDADGNDRLVIVDVSTASHPGTGDVAVALSQLGATVAITPPSVPLQGTTVSYDPRGSATLQALPVGVEILDTFYYEVIDIGSGAVNAITNGTGSNTWVTARHHRLNTGDSVKLFGVSVAAYNGEFEITVLDENTFAIPVTFGAVAEEPGVWETVKPRVPSERSEAAVTVRVTGVNDAPAVAGDVVTNVTEASVVRIMARPELANTAMNLDSDPVPPPVPNPAHLLDNDSDIDADDTWQTLRLVGVMGAVHAILDYSGDPGQSPVTVRSPAHGLISGTEILIANYGGHPSYNGYHTVTVIDADTFTIPRFFVDNEDAKGVWAVLNDSNRYQAVTDVGATVDLILRADVDEDHLIYDASASSFLNGLAEDERYTDRFYQAVADRHGAIGIGPVDIVVTGLNDTPTALPDPTGIGVLSPLVSPSNTLESVLANSLDILYSLPPASGTTGRVDVQTLDLSGTLPGTIVLPDLWATDEATPIAIQSASLLANDTDMDRLDVLQISAVDAFSREGASLTLDGGQIVYDPTASAMLQALARDERVIDSFYAVVTDTMTGGTVTSLVAVLVTGLNDTPVAQPDAIELSEDDVFTFNPILYPADTVALHDYDLDINGLLPDDLLNLIAVSNLITTGEARVDLQPLLAQYDATVSVRLNQLADWQDYTDSFEYTVTDNSFLFIVDDEFYVPADTVGQTLDVLANDRDFTPQASTLTIVEVGPTLMGGTITITPDGRHLAYSSPAGVAVDDFFRYVVENEAGNRRSARVLVRSVIPPQNGILSTANDHYAVAYGETAVLDVLANDNLLPADGAGLVLAPNVVETSMPGQPIVSGNAFVYTATNGLSPLTFTYEVSAGGASVARATVVVDIVDRRGTLNVRNDTLSVPADSSDNELDVLANDNLITGATATLRIAELIDSAAFGTATINVSATALVYTPDPGFLGVEQLRYLVSDGLGGTGTGVVSVSVGNVEAMIDFFAVEASTNGLGVSLNVLDNDRVQPFPAGALTLVSVTPASTAIGTMQVSTDRTRLEFVPSNVVGRVDFVYLVSDSSARTATGSVTVATVPAGIYAGTDRFKVRKDGANYELDVLANDRSYPDVNKSYSILSIGTGSEAPNAGGSVSIVDNRLIYTPAAGFSGQESFKYTMSDAVATDSAWVTVTVGPGDLVANADHFGVFYELEGGSANARSFTLPVVLNDRIQPVLGQVIQVSGLGVGANAPDHLGEVSIGADGLSLVYRPVEVPATSYVERFTYEISDGTERRASAVVEVQVFNRADKLDALTQDDCFTVARNSADNVLPLLRNDFSKPGTAAGWSITTVSATTHDGIVTNSGAYVLYTPADGFVGLDEFTYSVNDGLGGTGSATVRVRVGAQPTLPDLFVALSGSESNDLDVTANDVLTAEYAGEYMLAGAFGATHGGSVMLSPSNTLLYTPAASYAGPYPYTESFFYTVADDADGMVTGTVQVIVHETGSDQSTTTVTVHVEGRNDSPVILNEPANAPITDKETARPFTGMTLVEVDQQTLEPVDVLVWLDDAAKGTLQELGGFVDLGAGRYGLSGVTAAYATAQIRNLLFVPTENRITVPTTETTTFTVQVTDNKSPPVTDAQSAIAVTAVTDAPVIQGTRAGQTVYAATPIRLFSSVTIREVDDLTLQPLDVTIRLSDPSHGLLSNLGSFVPLSNGVYVATGITAAAATQQLRLMEFLHGAYSVQPGAPQLTIFSISVDDRFAAPVVDDTTSVWAYSAYEDTVQPESAALQRSFGFAVDTASDFAVVGTPAAAVNGTDSGSALVYRLQPGTTNSWEIWRQLQPGEVDASDKFGHSVAISEDLIAVGAIQDEVDGSAVGTVYLFQRDLGGSNNWGLLTRIAPTNLPASSQFGFAVDLDGDLLAVGAPKATDAGAVLLFGRNEGGMNAWGEIKRWEPAGQTSTACGTSVSVSGDYLVAGAPKNITGLAAGTPLGAAYFLSRHAGGTDNWGLVQRIVAPNLTTASDFGYCVSVDRDILAVGAPKVDLGNSEMGQVFLYWKAAGSNVWTEVSQLDERGDQGAHFGYSLSVNKDFVFIGAPGWGNTNSVYAYLYRHDALDVGTWRQVERLVCPVGPQSLFPPSCAVSFKQDAAIVGVTDNALSPYGYTGKAHMYRFKFNNAPAVATPVADQFAEWNEPFSYTLPDGIFTDPDVGDTLAVQAALPVAGSGLSVAGLTVSGTPTVIGPVSVEVAATDESGAGALDTFDVIVRVDGVPLDATPRNLWDLEHFGKAVVNPALESTLWGGLANADGDAANNDREYAFGGDPTVGDASGLILLSPATEGNRVITYIRRRDDPALTYTVQCTATLTPPAWIDVQTWGADEQATVIDDAYEQVDVTVNVSAAGPAMFFRVIVTP